MSFDPFGDDFASSQPRGHIRQSEEPADGSPAGTPPESNESPLTNNSSSVEETRKSVASPQSSNQSRSSVAVSSSSAAASVGEGNIFHWISSQLTTVAGQRDHFKFDVSVSDPEKKGDSVLSTHMTYKVTASLDGVTSIVIRRFSEFVWLHDALSSNSKYFGFIIPAVPDKALMGKFEAEFVEERRIGLEGFLKRILAHHQMRLAEEVQLFLTGSDVQMAAAKSGKASSGSSISMGGEKAKSKTGFMSFFKDAAQSLQAHIQAPKEREKSTDDTACERVFEYASTLESQLNALHGQAEALVKREKSLAKSNFELGLSSTVLGQAESQAGNTHLAQVFSALGNGCDQLSTLLTKKFESEQFEFLQSIKDWSRMAESLKLTMKLRLSLLQKSHDALNLLELRQRSEKKLESEINAAEEEVRAREQELTVVTSTLKIELAKFQLEKEKNMRATVEKFVKLQIEHARAAQNAWESVLNELPQ